MELYVKVQFWMLLISLFIRLMILSVKDYPRTEEIKIGLDIAIIIERLFFIGWASALLFIK